MEITEVYPGYITIKSPLCATITIKCDGRGIKLVYQYKGEDTLIYTIKETKQHKLVMNK